MLSRLMSRRVDQFRRFALLMRRRGCFHFACIVLALNARMQGRAVPKRFLSASAAREAVFSAAAYEPTTLLFAARC